MRIHLLLSFGVVCWFGVAVPFDATLDARSTVCVLCLLTKDQRFPFGKRWHSVNGRIAAAEKFCFGLDGGWGLWQQSRARVKPYHGYHIKYLIFGKFIEPKIIVAPPECRWQFHFPSRTLPLAAVSAISINDILSHLVWSGAVLCTLSIFFFHLFIQNLSYTISKVYLFPFSGFLGYFSPVRVHCRELRECHQPMYDSVLWSFVWWFLQVTSLVQICLCGTPQVLGISIEISISMPINVYVQCLLCHRNTHIEFYDAVRLLCVHTLLGEIVPVARFVWWQTEARYRTV